MSEQKTVKLWCEAGEHYWDRPAQRGRKPNRCPNHAVEMMVRPKSSKGESNKLWCDAGEHWWERPAQVGRKPTSCDEHRVREAPRPAQPSGAPQMLWCIAGEHWWEREPKPGRRPFNCSKHSAPANPQSTTGTKTPLQTGQEEANLRVRQEAVERVEAWREWLKKDVAWWSSVRRAERSGDPSEELPRVPLKVIPKSHDFEIAREEGVIA